MTTARAGGCRDADYRTVLKMKSRLCPCPPAPELLRSHRRANSAILNLGAATMC